jgi:hypothetical protein
MNGTSAVKAPSTKVVTGKVRLSYVHIFEPYAFDNSQEEQYSLCILIPKSDKATINKINAAIEAAKQDGLKKWGGRIPAKLWNPLRDGDEEHPEDPAFADCMYLNAKSKHKPGVVDANLNQIIDKTEVYSGCYGRVSVVFYPFSASGNNGVGCGLQNVQKLADGEPLGGRSNAEDDFNDGFSDEEDFLG